MKNIFVITLIAALIGSTTATTAKADREGRALLGGLIGGIIIGSVISDDDHHHHADVNVHYGSRHRGHNDGCGCRGYYDYITVKTWIPGGWSVRYDRHGHCYRDWHPGHYSYSKKSVWFSHRSSCRYYSSPRHDRYYDNGHRGYGRRGR